MSSRPSHRKPAKGEYIETDTGNKISRRSKIEGTPHIVLNGRVVVQADACLRGDLVRSATTVSEVKQSNRTAINVGRYTVISNGATLHPPHRILRGGDIEYIPMTIGSHVFIGAGTYIAAASVGSNVYIDKGCVIGNACMIGDRVKILEGSVMVAGMAVPSDVVVGGRPARIVEDVPDGWGMSFVSARDGEWVEGGDLRELVRSIK